MKLSRDGTTSPYPWWIADERHDIVLQICKGFIDGLSYLHSHSIKHKDIKPENLLLHCPSYESGQTPRVLPCINVFSSNHYLGNCARIKGKSNASGTSYSAQLTWARMSGNGVCPFPKDASGIELTYQCCA